MRFGTKVVRVVRTEPLESGVRSVWYLPDGSSVHAIEDDPIEPGAYFLRPDDTGRFRNWVIERVLNTREAVPQRGEHLPARVDVEVHIGNVLDDTEACTCPGMTTWDRGVHSSRIAINHMRKVLQRDVPDPPVWFLHIIE